MEKCEKCNHEFSINSRREEKRVEEFKAKTGMLCCPKCRDKYSDDKAFEIANRILYGAGAGRYLDPINNMIMPYGPIPNKGNQRDKNY